MATARLQGGKRRIKFPIVPDGDYLDLIKNKVTILSLDKNDFKVLKGISWREFAYKLYDLLKIKNDKYKPGVYSYTMKVAGDDELHFGSIKLLSNEEPMATEPTTDITTIREIEKLKSEIKNLSSKDNGIGVDTLLQITRQSYETQINFLNQDISRKQSEINKLETKINSLEDELNTQDRQIAELEGKTGIGQYISIAKEFLSMKVGNMKPVENLADSNPSDIPAEILQVIGLVEWSKVPENVQAEIVNYLKIFIQKLPMKGA